MPRVFAMADGPMPPCLSALTFERPHLCNIHAWFTSLVDPCRSRNAAPRDTSPSLLSTVFTPPNSQAAWKRRAQPDRVGA
jgi:hypothetical protein